MCKHPQQYALGMQSAPWCCTGNSTTKAAVVAKMKQLNVQLDNLCQVRR